MTRRITPSVARCRSLGAGVVLAVLLLAGCSGDAVGGSSPSASSSPQPPSLDRPADPAGEVPEELEASLRDTVEATIAEYGVPGAVAGVWIPEGGTWTTAVGTADVDGGVPVRLAMQWPLRSITKSYTVTLILQLADEGVISLDDSIDEYVEGVTDGDRITLRDLAGMTSGNADYTNDDFVAAFSRDPERIFTSTELNGFMLGKPPQFAPGAQRVYTNANTNLLGAVVEKATGQPFDTVLRERILDPLTLHDTEYMTDVATWDAAHPVGYAPGAGGLENQETNMSVFGPAGSMVSTLDDGRVWAEVLAGGALLSDETQRERLEGAPLDAGPPYDRYALGIGETGGWWGHNGEGFGFTAALFHHPDSGRSIIVFMNLAGHSSGAHPADQLFRRLAAVIDSEFRP